MKRIIYSLLFAAGTLFAGCSDDDTQAPLNTPIQEGNNLYGVVTDPNGAPVGGIVVSDGFSCVATDANGVYQMPRHADAFHVFYRIPADREIPMSEGRPCFWQRLSKTQERYDFVLMPQQAVETDFKLVCIADPQVQKDTDLARFKEESVPDIRAHVSTLEGPVYGITLGDIIFNEKAKDVTNQMMPPIALAMRESEIGLKLFQVMGNHDNCMTPTVTDESSNFDLAGRRNFEYKFGPCDYSFDRGNAHIVAMDDVLLTDEKHNPSDYEGGFTDAQVEWLRQDLSLVPKEKLVIFCVHIPLRNATSFNRETVRNLLKEFDNVHIMAGHTHYAQNYPRCRLRRLVEIDHQRRRYPQRLRRLRHLRQQDRELVLQTHAAVEGFPDPHVPGRDDLRGRLQVHLHGLRRDRGQYLELGRQELEGRSV